FGKFGDDGLLINLRTVFPSWTVQTMVIATTAFFFYWLFFRKQNNKGWLIRPEFAKKQREIKHKLSA
ncbi:MAG: hypothetical protein ACXVB0_23525, partial [Mucilaginibacter sp.]